MISCCFPSLEYVLKTLWVCLYYEISIPLIKFTETIMIYLITFYFYHLVKLGKFSFSKAVSFTVFCF